MKNIYQHNIELEPIRINNADKATFSQKLIDLPYRGYEVEENSLMVGKSLSRSLVVNLYMEDLKKKIF